MLSASTEGRRGGGRGAPSCMHRGGGSGGGINPANIAVGGIASCILVDNGCNAKIHAILYYCCCPACDVGVVGVLLHRCVGGRGGRYEDKCVT